MAGASADGGSRFFTTDWSLVKHAGDESVSGDRTYLSHLLLRYLRALKAHVRRKWGLRDEEAEDVIQSFIADKILERGLIEKADQNRGKFRTFLCTALDRYVISRHRKGSKHKTTHVDVESELAASEATTDVFVQEWAHEVIRAALERMKAECNHKGREDIWEVFDCQILQPTLGDRPPLPYQEFVGRFGFQSALQASNACITAKRMYERALRAVVSEYTDARDIDAEIEELFQILSQSRPSRP